MANRQDHLAYDLLKRGEDLLGLVLFAMLGFKFGTTYEGTLTASYDIAMVVVCVPIFLVNVWTFIKSRSAKRKSS